MSRKFKRALFVRAYEILDGIPSERFDLSHIAINERGGSATDPSHCGTIACGLGWLAAHPKFRPLSLLNYVSGGRYAYLSQGDYQTAGAATFGISTDDAKALFSAFAGRLDPSELRNHTIGSVAPCDAKAVLLARMRRFLAEQDALELAGSAA